MHSSIFELILFKFGAKKKLDLEEKVMASTLMILEDSPCVPKIFQTKASQTTLA